MCGLALLCSFATAQSIEVSPGTETVAITNYVEYYEDSTEQLTIDDVLNTNFN